MNALIVGGGISGISAAVHLMRNGERDIVLVEASDELGGTWRDNTYPGCACDIPSHIYSFPFAPNPSWTRIFTGQDEIRRYILRVAAAHGVFEITRFSTEMIGSVWDEQRQAWHVETSKGDFLAKVLVLAPGPFHAPQIPELPGLETFEGEVFHSARWNHRYDLAGKRVAVIGTGASSIQFVPVIQPQVKHVTVFQRTPAWVFPKPDWPVSTLGRRLLARVPGLQRLLRGVMWLGLDAMVTALRHPRIIRLFEPIGRWNINRAVGDPVLRAALTPDYTLGCKRVLISNHFYPALTQPNADLVTSGVAEVRRNSVMGANGVEYPVDCIIFGTGFHVQDPPIARRVTGRRGQSLAQVWGGSPVAYLGTSVSGFPNMFYMFGPNAGVASAFIIAEAQSRYLVSAVEMMQSNGIGAVDALPLVQARFKKGVDEALQGSVWNSGGCQSYYLGADGQNATLWPGTMRSLLSALDRFPLESYTSEALIEEGGSHVST